MKTKSTAKAAYTDGFLIPVPKRNIAAYRRIASKACKIWMEYGAIDYKECVGDDLNIKGVVSFTKQMKAKKGETVIIAWITYRSKKQRDAVNTKIMKDPRIAAMMDTKSKPVFDMKKMVYGGFKIIVSS
jgi:uncharacterized protein YbaA (DUF1428 family)